MNTQNRCVAIAVVTLLMLAGSGCSRRTGFGFNGTWLKKAGSSDMADALTVRRRKDQFTMKYWADGGIETITLRLDGDEHLFSKVKGVSTTYRAQLTEDTLFVTKRINGKLADGTTVTGYPYTEQWTLRDGGRRLVVSALGEETVFERAPAMRALFVGAP